MSAKSSIVHKTLTVKHGSWNQIKKMITPLDLVFFKGNSIAADALVNISKYEDGIAWYSHAAIVVTSDLLPDHGLIPGKIYILESTFFIPVILPANGTLTNDVITGKSKIGVQLRELEGVMEKYWSSGNNTLVGIGKIKDNPWLTQDHDILRDKFYKTFVRYHNINYGFTPRTVINTLLNSLFCCMNLNEVVVLDEVIEDDITVIRPMAYCIDRNINSNIPYNCNNCMYTDNNKTSIFCSELCVIVYQDLGILNPHIDPSLVLPNDFIMDRDGAIPDDFVSVILNITN